MSGASRSEVRERRVDLCEAVGVDSAFGLNRCLVATRSDKGTIDRRHADEPIGCHERVMPGRLNGRGWSSKLAAHANPLDRCNGVHRSLRRR